MMLSALYNDKWLMNSNPFSSFGNMESEIAELRTLTKVTKLRQQIECRQEGAWMMVRNVPDDKCKSGNRKVTSFGRSSKSVTRSFSQNISRNLETLDTLNPTNVVVELPPEKIEEKNNNKNQSVEITEVLDEPCQNAHIISETAPLQILEKKTSVVTLGKGNIVVIDDEDSNFQVTGISKGRVAEAVNTLEKVTQGDKKVKKVGFCKTEVHFAPDSGRVKIVETDEKPPPTQILRKKKRQKIKTTKQDLPKLYFGNPADDIKDLPNNIEDQKSVFSFIREPSPLLTLFATTQATEKNDEKNENYGYIKKGLQSNELKYENKPGLSYLGNVSPKLSKLLQNNMQHEFQVKQKQITKNKISEESNQINLNIDCESIPNRPLKIVTQVSLGDGGGEVEHKLMLKSTNEESEPIYINKDVTVELKHECNYSKPVNSIREKTPKPRPRTTINVSPQKEVKNVKLTKHAEKTIKKVSPKPKDTVKKDSIQNKPIPKQYSKSSLSKPEKRGVKGELNNTNIKLQKLIKNGSGPEKPSLDAKVRKAREPLRSFEKVSNGWVGHCITPFKGTSVNNPKEAKIIITTKVSSNKAISSAHSIHNQGLKRSNMMSGTKNSRFSNEIKTHNKSSLSENKQFSLSKEHLRSAKLVKELSNKKEKQVGDGNSPMIKIHTSPKEVASQILGNRPTPRVGIVRPRIIQQSHSVKKSNTTAIRIGIPRSEHSLLRQRRDSEQSDDSVVRADEEVRAYMFNTRLK